MELNKRIFGKSMLEFKFNFHFKIRKMNEFEYISNILDERIDIDYVSNARPKSYESSGKLLNQEDNTTIDYDGWIHMVSGLKTYRFYFGENCKLIAASENNQIKTISLSRFKNVISDKQVNSINL